MDIRFVSTLTADDEERLGGALLSALVALLDGLPITYALRIQTTSAKIFQQTNVSSSDSVAEAATDPSVIARQSPGREHVQ